MKGNGAEKTERGLRRGGGRNGQNQGTNEELRNEDMGRNKKEVVVQAKCPYNYMYLGT